MPVQSHSLKAYRCQSKNDAVAVNNLTFLYVNLLVASYSYVEGVVESLYFVEGLEQFYKQSLAGCCGFGFNPIPSPVLCQLEGDPAFEFMPFYFLTCILFKNCFLFRVKITALRTKNR